MSSAIPPNKSPRSHPKPSKRSNSNSHPQENEQQTTNPPHQKEDALKQLKEKASQLEQDNNRLQEELTTERRQAERENGPRDVQLEGLKEYLDTHDKCGLADILSKLDLVNDLIDQLASDISGLYEEPQTQKPADVKIARNASGLCLAIGGRLAEILDTCDPTDAGVAVVLQYAVQTVLLFEVIKLCDVDFAFRADEPRKHALYTVAKRIQEKEIQPIYGRWRALAHRHLRAAETPEARDQKIARFLSRVQGMLTDIQDAIFGVASTPEQRAELSPHTESSLQDLFKHASQLSIMIKEEVISSDLIVFGPRPGKPFRPDGMEFPYDTSDSAQASEPDVVISTVKLGLLSKGKQGRENGPAEEKLKRKAQVFTEHALRVILDPPKPKA